MSSMQRAVDGDVLVHHLTQDITMLDQDTLARSGRTGRTLVKDGPLRLTMLSLAPDGALPEHSTTGPVSVHILQGSAIFVAMGIEYTLATNDILVLAPGVRHSARSAQGCTFLLTIVHTPSAGSPLAAA